MYTTSHQRMRGRRIVTDQGCVVPQRRQGRQPAKLRAIAESSGVR